MANERRARRALLWLGLALLILFLLSFSLGRYGVPPLTVVKILAARFVEKAILATPVSTPFGADFEPILPWLWQQL